MRTNIKSKRWAYLAGLIDGDGSISLTEHESPIQVHFFLNLKVTSTQRRQINWLVEQFGGQLENAGKQKGNDKPCFSWMVKDKKHISNILRGVVSYLVQKKETALKAIEYADLPFGLEDPALRSKYAKEISRLNHINVPVEERPWKMVCTKPSFFRKEILAYASGILDAEGTFSSPTPQAQSPQIQVANTDMRLLDWLYVHFGGISFASVDGRENRRDEGLWRFSGGRCQKKDHLNEVKKAKELFLLSVLPYLVQKRKQASISLGLLRGDYDPQYCFDELKKLNSVGTQTANTSSSPNNGLMIESDPEGNPGSTALVTATV